MTWKAVGTIRSVRCGGCRLSYREGGTHTCPPPAVQLRCPECNLLISERTIYHQVEIIDPDESLATMLAERANCSQCGDVYLRNASADF